MESGLWESYYPLICAASNREMLVMLKYGSTAGEGYDNSI